MSRIFYQSKLENWRIHDENQVEGVDTNAHNYTNIPQNYAGTCVCIRLGFDCLTKFDSLQKRIPVSAGIGRTRPSSSNGSLRRLWNAWVGFSSWIVRNFDESQIPIFFANFFDNFLTTR